jgi:hypothetical protein
MINKQTIRLTFVFEGDQPRITDADLEAALLHIRPNIVAIDVHDCYQHVPNDKYRHVQDGLVSGWCVEDVAYQVERDCRALNSPEGIEFYDKAFEAIDGMTEKSDLDFDNFYTVCGLYFNEEE